MQTKIVERVFETTNSTGTGELALTGAITGAITFASAFLNGAEVYYGITVESTGQYEYGVGTFLTNPSRLRRDQITRSSASDVAVDWGVGVKNVFSHPPAKLIPLLDKGVSSTENGKIAYLEGNGKLKFTKDIAVDSINEFTASSGVTIGNNSSSITIVGGKADLFKADKIAEKITEKGVNFMHAVNFFAPQNISGGATIGVFNTSASNTYHVTGASWTCTSLGSSGVAGMARTLIFDGVGTLQNSSNLILFGSNITTAVGDSATFLAESATISRCIAYFKADGTPLYLPTIMFPGFVQLTASPTSPTGWTKANGAALSRSSYASLFASIGTYWGAGDGSTTFNAPDLRGEFIRCWDDGRGVDSGRAFGSFQDHQLVSHRHGTAGGGGQGGGISGTGNYGNSNNYVLTGGGTDSFFTSYEGGSENRVRNKPLLALVKY